MPVLNKAFPFLLATLIFMMSGSWKAFGEESPAGAVGTVVIARLDRGPTMDPRWENNGKGSRDGGFNLAASKGGEGKGSDAKGDPPGDKGKPGPLPCKSKNNPKCSPESPSK